jgi:hypothetical protein
MRGGLVRWPALVAYAQCGSLRAPGGLAQTSDIPHEGQELLDALLRREA